MTVYAEALRRQVSLSAWWGTERAAEFQIARWQWMRDLLQAEIDQTEQRLELLDGRVDGLGQAIADGVTPDPALMPDPEAEEQWRLQQEEGDRLRELLEVARDDEQLMTGDPAAAEAYLLGRGDSLRRARAYYVTEQMVGLVNAAYYSRPAEPLRLDHLPCPSGFMWLAAPAVYTYGAGHSALQWEPSVWGRDREPAVRVTAWLATNLKYPKPEHLATAVGFGSYIPWSFEWPLGREAAVGEDVDRDFAHCSRWAQAAWSLMQQQLASVGAAPVDRHARKQAVRDKVTPDVTVVTLRAAKPAKRDGEPRAVDWRGRWLVRGFWRNQWYPSSQEHRPIWIDDFVKGPEDRPFLVRERVTVWRR